MNINLKGPGKKWSRLSQDIILASSA